MTGFIKCNKLRHNRVASKESSTSLDKLLACAVAAAFFLPYIVDRSVQVRYLNEREGNGV